MRSPCVMFVTDVCIFFSRQIKRSGYVIQGGGVVRALTSHQCSPGSIHRPDVTWAEFAVGSQLSKKIFQLKVFHMKNFFLHRSKKVWQF